MNLFYFFRQFGKTVKFKFFNSSVFFFRLCSLQYTFGVDRQSLHCNITIVPTSIYSYNTKRCMGRGGNIYIYIICSCRAIILIKKNTGMGPLDNVSSAYKRFRFFPSHNVTFDDVCAFFF